MGSTLPVIIASFMERSYAADAEPASIRSSLRGTSPRHRRFSIVFHRRDIPKGINVVVLQGEHAVDVAQREQLGGERSRKVAERQIASDASEAA